MLIAAVILYIILILVTLPLNVRGHVFLSVSDKLAVVNVDLFGLPPFSIRLELDEGVVLTVGKRKQKQLINKEKFVQIANKAKKIKIDPAVLKIIKVRKWLIRGVFGADDAAATAMGCVGAEMLLRALSGAIVFRPERSEIRLIPDYEKARLEIEAEVRTTFNLSMIIFSVFKILTKKE